MSNDLPQGQGLPLFLPWLHDYLTLAGPLSEKVKKGLGMSSDPGHLNLVFPFDYSTAYMEGDQMDRAGRERGQGFGGEMGTSLNTQPADTECPL